MKNIIYILLFISQTFWAQSVFDKGNDQYRKGNYQEAISAYESILKGKKESCDLYFNLANSYYKLNKIAPAIYYYEKALLLNPTDEEVLNNLEFAQAMTIDDIKPVPEVGVSAWMKSFAGLLPYNTWAYLSVFLSVCIVAFFAGYYFSRQASYKRFSFISMMSVYFILFFVLQLLFELIYFQYPFDSLHQRSDYAH